MTFYHFTSKYHIEDCLKFGITKGVLVRYTSNKPVLHLGIQWLTTNPNPQKQTWAKNIDLDYDRTEYRIEIRIPKRHLKNVIKWIDYSENKKEYEPLNMFEGKEDWYIYLGKIPREWIKRYIKISKCKRYNSIS